MDIYMLHPIKKMLQHGIVTSLQHVECGFIGRLPNLMAFAEKLHVVYALRIKSDMVIAQVFGLRAHIDSSSEMQQRISQFFLIPQISVPLSLGSILTGENTISPLYGPFVIFSHTNTSVAEIYLVMRTQGVIKTHIIHNGASYSV